MDNTKSMIRIYAELADTLYKLGLIDFDTNNIFDEEIDNWEEDPYKWGLRDIGNDVYAMLSWCYHD